MKKLEDTLEILIQEIGRRIAELIKAKGEESKHGSDIVLKIKDEEQMYNLEGGRWLVEITENKLIDNEGYSYDLCVLRIGELCGVLDSFI